MRIVAQRVSASSVSVGGEVIGSIGAGLCILVGVGPDDTEEDARRLADKISALRIFGDADGKMNLSLLEIGGEALVISQFTLYADCRKGRRPSFIRAAAPELADRLYKYFAACLREKGLNVPTGKFGADMKVEITNEGPVTIILDSQELSA